MTISALAGTPLETVQGAAREACFMLPLDLGARGSCTIGGNIATNAGGNQVIQYGMVRNSVLGLETVLADGSIIASRNKLLKNNTGFDLKHLFIGSEGTLGVVTEVILRLFPVLSSRQSALCAMQEVREVIAFLHAMKKNCPLSARSRSCGKTTTGMSLNPHTPVTRSGTVTVTMSWPDVAFSSALHVKCVQELKGFFPDLKPVWTQAPDVPVPYLDSHDINGTVKI